MMAGDEGLAACCRKKVGTVARTVKLVKSRFDFVCDVGGYNLYGKSK